MEAMQPFLCVKTHETVRTDHQDFEAKNSILFDLKKKKYQQ